MMKTFERREVATLLAATALGVFTGALPAAAQMSQMSPMGQRAQRVPMVGGAPMYPTKTIVENAINSRDHTTLVAAVKAAGLVDTLSGPGPFTVFAPTNAAFAKLPRGTVQTLVRPENKQTLTPILTYHVVAGRFSANDLMAQAMANGGRTTLRTVNGGTLTVRTTRNGRGLDVIDAKGNVSRITIADVGQSNGVIHVVNTVLMP